MQWEIPGTPSEYPLAQLLRPWLILLGCFLPAAGMFLYNCSGIMDRYVARTWFTAFMMCTAILTLIYIIGDFSGQCGEPDESGIPSGRDFPLLSEPAPP